MPTYFYRPEAELNLYEFLKHSTKAGLVFLRGRRRVGKSSLLDKVHQQNLDKCFYFSGALDETASATIHRFCIAWDAFTKKQDLSIINKQALNWEIVFQRVIEYSQKNPLWIFIDEIQWLAKAQNGFVGLFKQAWLQLEKSNSLKIVLCGSSNKFFVDHTGGEEKILRGMITHADIWLKPLTPHEVKKYYGTDLSSEEVLFLYLCFGGIPYYLNQFDFTLGFIRGFNDAVMTSKGVFLSEADEVLNLDITTRGLPTVRSILLNFTARYSTLETIRKKSRLAASTVTEIVEKLLQYGVVRELSEPDERIKAKRRNSLIYYTDFFLSFYFKFLYKHRVKIRNNISGNIFASTLTSKLNFYIENFSGVAFENFIHYCLETLSVSHPFLGKFNIVDSPLTLISDTQSDLVFKSNEEKNLRYIECKYTTNQSVLAEGLEQLSQIETSVPHYKVLRYLVTNLEPSARIIDKAKELGVTIVGLDALWES